MKNIHLKKSGNPSALLPVLTGLAVLLTGVCVNAAVTVNSIVTPNGGGFTYSYTVTNFGTTFDLAIVDFPVADGLTNVTAPIGFLAIFDGSPINSISFLEDSDPATTQTFAPNSTSASFSFDSPFAPSLVNFSALDANGDTYTGTTQSAIPEPSSLMLLGAVALPLLATRRRTANR